MSRPSPAERRLTAQVAAHASWAATSNRSVRTAKARAALDARFLTEADGDPIRAEHLRKAHFARLALRSAQARRKSREAAEKSKALLSEAEDAETELSELAGGGRG